MLLLGGAGEGGSVSIGELIGLASFIGAILLSLSTYLNSVRKAEFERLQARVVEAEKRQADSDKRAADNERRAFEYRNDVIHIGEQIEAEQRENARRLAMVAEDGNRKINQVVLVLEKVLKDFESATGRENDVDIEALKRLVVIDHITGPLETIDTSAVKRYSS